MSADPRVRRRRWLIYGVAASMYFVSYLHRVAPAVVAADLMRAFSISAATLGNLGALMAATPLALLVEAFGWRETFVFIGAVTALLAALAALVVRDRPEAMGFISLAPRPARAASLTDVLRGIPLVVGNAHTWPP